MNTKRTDLAAPTVIDPAAFTFVAGVYFGAQPSEDFDELLSYWMAEKDPNGNAGWYSKRAKVREQFRMLNPEGNFMRKGTCDHCGAAFDWGSVYVHTSGGHIVVGNICADKTMSVPSRLELDVSRMKSRIAAHRKAARMAAAARQLAFAGGYEWLYASEHDHPTLRDIARKGLQYGGITPRQLELVRKIHDGTPTEYELARDAKRAARAAEEAAAEPVPETTERVEVEGEVLTTKEQDGYLPGQTQLKMLVKTTRGFKLWGSVPAVLLDGTGLIGKRVAFAAKIERSRDDEKFGFFSRPTKARFVSPAA